VRPALRHRLLAGSPARQCRRIAGLAGSARGVAHARLTVARDPDVVFVSLRRARTQRPRSWGRVRAGVLMRTPGSLRATVAIPNAGRWEVWVRGQIMPAVTVSIDGRRLGRISGQLGGNSLVASPAPPIGVHLSAGVHQLVLTREDSPLAPGEGGAAALSGLFLTPAGGGAGGTLLAVPLSRWRTLCGGRYEWVELSVKE